MRFTIILFFNCVHDKKLTNVFRNQACYERAPSPDFIMLAYAAHRRSINVCV